jgi:glycerol uptake facilitator-like aquaporin
MRERLLAEAIGSSLLSASVIGSGVMAERLADGNSAVALLANTGATVGALSVLIALLAPVSGAHFNPAVSMVQAMRRAMSWPEAAAYAGVQIAGCCIGAFLAHAMFELPLLQFSVNVRTGAGQWLSEVIATCGLMLVILGHRRPQDAPWMVAGWIGAAYWFTASTAFANPAITIARSLSDTFAGIRMQDAPFFIMAQLVGACIGLMVAATLHVPAPDERRTLPRLTSAE